MSQIFLLEVEYEDVYANLVCTDVIFAGVDCETIYLEVSELLKKRLRSLEGSEIIEIIEEKYSIAESTKEYLLEHFPESEEEDYFGYKIRDVFVKSLPLEFFESLDKFESCGRIVPAAKIINEKGSSFIGYGDNILLLDDENRICGGEFLEINKDFDEEDNKDTSIIFVGVLDEVIEIEASCVRGIRKL